MLAKAGLGLIGLGAISIGGVAFTKPEWLGINREISWTPLSADEGYKDGASEDAYNGKFGSTYKDYLVGVVGTKKGEKLNKRMWEKLFERLENDNKTKGKFKRKGEGALAVTTAYSDETATALNKVCDAAYKSTETEGFGSEDTKFKKDEVWKYCSPGVLVKIDESKQGDNTIGKESGNAKILVSTESADNDWFWEIRNKDFWKDSGTWSGSGATQGTDSDKSVFKEAYTSQKNNESSRTTIKKLCEDAYKKPKNSTHNSNDAKKFCQLEKTGS